MDKGKKSLTKKVRLEVAFKRLLTRFAKDVKDCENYNVLTNAYTNVLLKEVSIRTPLK